MLYVPMWPSGHTKGAKELSIGVQITYSAAGEDVSGDYGELVHILTFLSSYFKFGAEDFKEKSLDITEKRFPFVWKDLEPHPFKRLIKSLESEDDLEYEVDLGFADQDQGVFRAYTQHLSQDETAPLQFRRYFAEIEKDFFGTKGQLN